MVKASEMFYPDPYSTSVKIFVDGQSVDGRSNCYTSPWQYTFHGYKIDQEGHSLKCRAFTFGKMDITSKRHRCLMNQDMSSSLSLYLLDDDSVKKKLGAELQNICTIRVDISAKKRMGSINHNPFNQVTYSLPSSSVQHEDSKPALWGISAK